MATRPAALRSVPWTRIVTTHYRYKPPPTKRKAVAIAAPAIVRKVKAAKGVHTADTPKSGQAPPPPANDDRKPAIVTTTSRSKRGRSFAVSEPDEAEDSGRGDYAHNRRAAIVTARRQGARRVDVPDLTPEEYQRRGDAADALWRELVRRADRQGSDS